MITIIFYQIQGTEEANLFIDRIVFRQSGIIDFIFAYNIFIVI